MKCHNCGEEINDDAKFCKYCGAQTIQNTEEKSNKFGNLKIIGIIIIAIIAIFLVLGFLSGSEVSGPGFSLDLPSGYYSEESTYFASGGHVTPYYEVFDENGTNCISISYITKVENSKEIRKDIKGYMSDSGFEKIKKIINQPLQNQDIQKAKKRYKELSLQVKTLTTDYDAVEVLHEIKEKNANKKN